MGNEKRKPASTLRQRQARQTRELIVEAARSLFQKNGYGITTMEAIAERAGVAGSTVYAVFGSKRAILREIRAPWHRGSGIRETVYALPEHIDAAEAIRRFAHAARLQWELGSEVVAIYRGAAAADPQAAAELAAALKGRRAGLDAFTERLAGSLQAGLTREKASAVLRAMSLTEVYEELVQRSGWSNDDYEAWLAAALQRELLG